MELGELTTVEMLHLSVEHLDLAAIRQEFHHREVCNKEMFAKHRRQETTLWVEVCRQRPSEEGNQEQRHHLELHLHDLHLLEEFMPILSLIEQSELIKHR